MGTVREEDGHPVRDVDLVGGMPLTEVERSARTDAEGTYSLRLPCGEEATVVEVQVRGRGEFEHRVLADSAWVVPGQEPERSLDLVLASTEVRVSGTLCWEDGEPVEGGDVRAGTGRESQSDAAGRFVLQAGVLRSGIALSFGHRHRGEFSSGYRRIVPPPESLADGCVDGVELVLQRPGPVSSFLVLGRDARPVEDAEVRISGQEGSWGTDPDGRCEFRFPSRFLGRSVRVDAPGYEPCFVALEEPRQHSAAQVVQLLERDWVQGRVIDFQGVPVPHARIGVSEDPHSVGEIEVLACDDRGRFRFGAAVYGGPRYLVAAARGGARGTKLLLPVDRAREVTIVVTSPRSVRGQVLSPDGRGLEGVTVSARSAEFIDGTEDVTRSDLDGRWELSLGRDGEHVVHLHRTGFLARDIVCRAGDALRVVLEPAGVIDVLLVEAGSGQVLTRATVRIGGGEPLKFGSAMALVQGRLSTPSPDHAAGEQALLRVSDPLLGTAEVHVPVQRPGASTLEFVEVGPWRATGPLDR